MSFVKESSKLLTNKYFLYFIVFLASTNVLGYIVTNKINAIIFFILVSLLTYQFSKNMAVILLVAIIATNFLMVNKRMREGLEGIDNKTTSDNTTPNLTQNALNKITNIDPVIANAIPIVKDDQTTSPPLDPNNNDLNNKSKEKTAPMGVGSSVSNKQSSKTSEHFGPRLDYAKTIEDSYQNLDQLLGSDSIQQLTNDTQKLMSQQQNLFNTMQQMAPMIEGAKNMLGGFDIKSLTNSLNNVSNLTGTKK